MPDTFIKIPFPKFKEGSSFVATAYFRNSSDAATAPTTAQYRVDCLTTGKILTDWTDLTPAASNAITITATENAIQSVGNKTEKKQLTVQADQNTDTQTRDVSIWKIDNIRNF
jgi:hypothetical protein